MKNSRAASIICLLFFTLGLIFLGCRSEPKPLAVSSSPDKYEMDVLACLLELHFKSSLEKDTPLVIEDTFSISMLRMGQKSQKAFRKSLLSQASDQVSADLIGDFCDKNSKDQALWPELKKRLPSILISRDEMNTIFSVGYNQKPDGWDRFYAKYPKSPGIITISRVGFNRRGDTAMVYMGTQSHWLAGFGRIYIFRKQGEKWVEDIFFMGPTWIS